ncbi:uncharacterized protein LOC128997354 isoform X1 [Macrosteles quadrilineatus]|uniref:uncharacterized protein LOC128997354 isoform X1 n=1 Tax=Macrosteles quadrilineatus TaxID=74068 RepID=UPI0023E1B54B|nr:uncharacterized protein LOC128997354 isoform X1 [Macrosteles quadrilineatus]
MIRLVLVSSFIFILGFYEAKGAPNDLPLNNGETSTPYQLIEEKRAEVAAYGRVVEGKDNLSLPGLAVAAVTATVLWVGDSLMTRFYINRALTAAAKQSTKGKGGN